MKKVNGNTTHGLSKHPLHSIWTAIKQRCYNRKCKEYKWYGAKGITMCKSWLKSFMVFYEWAIENGWQKGLSIEREKLTGGYSPENCKWIPRSQQGLNKSDNIYATLNGETKCVSEWAKIYNIKCATIYRRFHMGWDLERAIITPLVKTGRKSKYITYNGMTKTMAEWSTELNISKEIIRYRYINGFDIAKSIRKTNSFNQKINNGKQRSHDVILSY